MKNFLAFVIAVFYFETIICEKVINCYYDTWSAYEQGAKNFEPANIDPTLCTHLSYSFFGIGNNGELKSLDLYLDFEKDFIGKTVALKTKNPKLKVLAVVSEWVKESVTLPAIAADPSKRARFISSSLNFIQEHDFDGLSLNWLYPIQRGGSPNDRQNLVILLKELNDALQPKNLVLSIVVSGFVTTADYAYDIPNISKYVDFINVIAYDVRRTWPPRQGINAPLRGNGDTNVKSAMEYWLTKGAPPNKLLLGISFFGRSFTIIDKTLLGPLARHGFEGNVYNSEDFLGYNEICQSLKCWNIKRDDKTAVLYASKDNRRMVYDDAQSIGLKMDFLMSMNLSGALICSIHVDDFRGTCGERYPLLKAINNSLNGEGNEKSNNCSTDIGNKEKHSKHEDNNREHDHKPESKKSECKIDGYFWHATECNKFYVCYEGYRYDFKCSQGLVFTEGQQICYWISKLNCNV